MSKQRMVFTMLAALALTVLCGCGGGKGGEPETSAGSMAPPEGTTDTSVSANVPEGSVVSGGKVFSLITMDTIDQFWLQVKEGAQAKADELGVNLRFDAPVGKTDAQAQSDMVENARHEWNDFFIYAASGTADFAYSSFKRQIDNMIAEGAVFRFADNETEGNIYYLEKKGGEHNYEYANLYLYNGLCWLWK